MDSRRIFSLISSNLKEILLEIKVEDISYDSKLCLLGASSIDKAELIEKTIEDLGIEADRFEFNLATNIGELTDLFFQKFNDHQLSLKVQA